MHLPDTSTSDENNGTDDRTEFEMNLTANRLKSFNDWPFDEESDCTPQKVRNWGLPVP